MIRKTLIALFLVIGAASANAAMPHAATNAVLANKTLDTKPIDPPRMVVGQESISVLGNDVRPNFDIKSKRDGWRQVARHRGSSLPVSAPITGCTKPNAVDFAGYATRCSEATQNPSFIWPTFFDDARQTGQAVYYWNYDTIPYDVACVHVGCGYDTTKLVNSPVDISFDASTASVATGVLTVNPVNLNANNGNVAVGQYLTCTGCPTSPRAKITANLSPTTWQTDAPSLTLSARAITGSRYPNILCSYNVTRSGISTIPVVYCATAGDSVTETLIEGYDFDAAGAWLRIVQGGGAGTNGEAGPVKVRHNKFGCNPASEQTSVSTGINTHFDFYVEHNEHNGRYPTCTGQAFLSNLTVGTPSKSQIAKVEWNALLNEGVLPMSGSGATGQGGGYYTYLSVSNNAITSANLSGAFHGAVYALSLSNYMNEYIYEHNLGLAYPAAVPAGLGTTTYSMLAVAGYEEYAHVGNMELRGNIAVTNIFTGNQPLSACNGNSALTAVQAALWKTVGIFTYDTFTSRGNLTDPTGATGCGIYSGGKIAMGVTASQTNNTVGDGLTTLTVTANNWKIRQNAKFHVNNTPFQWCGTITYNGDGATGSMVLDTATAGCPAAPALNVGNPVAGANVANATWISAKADSTHYTVKNSYCSGAATCTAADLTAQRQFMWTACSVMPLGTVDPATGLPSTGTGQNTGTYILGCDQTDISRSTYNQYNATILGTLYGNDGTDMLLTTGAGTYFGGFDWAYGIAP